MQLGVGEAAAAQLGGGAGGGDAAGDPAGRKVIAERGEARHVLAHGQHPGDAVASLREIGKRLQVFGDVDQTAAVHPGIVGNPPAAQGLDQPEVAAGLLQRRRRKGG